MATGPADGQRAAQIILRYRNVQFTRPALDFRLSSRPRHRTVLVQDEGPCVSCASLDAASPALSLQPLPGQPGPLSRTDFLDALSNQLGRNVGASCALTVIRFQHTSQTSNAFEGSLISMLAERLYGRLAGFTQAGALIGQMGHNEFALFFFHAAAYAADAAPRLIELVSRPYLLNGEVIHVGANAGIAHRTIGNDDGQDLYRCAALASFFARMDGKGQVRTFNADMARQDRERRALEFDLHKALKLRQLEVHYQPQVDSMTGRLAGFEALLRWRHPTRGLVPPDQFIPMAEELGLIEPIGDWVIRTACQEAARWPKDITIGVNIAAAQFNGGKLTQVVTAALAESGLPPERLDIEVVESILLRKDGIIIDTLHALQRQGVQVSIDDFGTGYSSLTQLQIFPFNTIKIDRSLISNLSSGAKGTVFLRAIALLAAELGMKSIVEGVETAEQLEQVRAHGCKEVQGYLFSRPVPSCDIPALLGRLHTPRPETLPCSNEAP